MKSLIKFSAPSSVICFGLALGVAQKSHNVAGALTACGLLLALLTGVLFFLSVCRAIWRAL